MANNFWDWARGSASLGGAGWLQNAVASKADGYKKRYTTENSWLQRLFALGQTYASDNPTNAQLGKWFKDTYGNQFEGNVSDYLKNIDDADLGALIENNYYNENNGGIPSWLGGDVTALDEESLLNDLRKLSNVDVGPNLEDYIGNYYEDAVKQISDENAAITKLYDENLNRQTANYNREMNDLNDSYNNYARQILSNDYQKNANIIGAYQSNMTKARQNSLEAGANAGLRIASNINTMLSAQNKQAATSLETSNQLAQAMMNQRNAAAGIRGQYNNMLDTDTNRRADLQRGNYERTMNAANANYESGMNRYNAANQVSAERNGNVTSPFADSYQTTMKARRVNNY